MKLSKSTTMLLNAVLILVIALLVTSLTGVSKNLFSNTTQAPPQEKPQPPPPKISDYEYLIDPIAFEPGYSIIGITKADMAFRRKSGFILERVDVEPWSEAGGRTTFWLIWKRKP